ncbi:MAG TPA: serine hydrolase, partial [Flavobacteriia bacterium]|nr:serine hydrolase [Flavobacteriia bacterium]
MKKYLFLFALLWSLISFSQTKEQLNHLDRYYQKALQEWHIPGMAIAIVKNDSVIFNKGYGYADLEKKSKVDANTLFAIASNSKAFTATALAQLVDQGKIKWTDKVIDYVPYFRLYDDYTTNHTTIEDLLCHRNGLKTFSGDLLWYGTDLSQEEIITKQGFLKPVAEFRTKYGYSNIQFIAAGKVIEKVTDTAWADYVKVHFIKPLKMNRTLTSVSQLDKASNVATPYYYDNGKNQKLEWINWDNMAPAGGIISSVNDYAKWMILNLNKGKFENKQIYSKNSYITMTTPHINWKVGDNKQHNHFSGYGLAWDLKDYQGYKIVGHSGGYDGMISRNSLVPEKKLGIVILTNNLNWAPSALANKTFDVLLANDLKGKDWSSDYAKIKKKQDSIAQEKLIKNEKLRHKINKHHLSFEKYTGVFKDKMYGTVTVTIKENKLHFTMDRTPIYFGDLNHWNDHVFTF